MKFIVKLFPEITIKSRPVRKRFIQRLQSNLQIILQRIEPKIKVRGLWDRIDIDCPPAANGHYEAIIAALACTPGISHCIEVQEYALASFDDVLAHVIRVYGERLQDKRFVVRVKRSGQHTFSSQDLERYIGGGLLQQTGAARVDLHTPEVTVNIEVKGQQLFIVERRIEGLGGYPQGTQEPVVSLISGGFDSIVASYLTMKRGAKTHFVFFNLGGAAHEAGVKQVAYFLWHKFGSAAKVKFVTVPFEGVVAEILQQVHHSHMGVVLKRMMLRAAERVGRRLKAEAMITGESIAQVSSQTLPNLAVIDKVAEGLVLRPLITFDKQDIIDIATQIGAYEFAASMPEYCGVISDRPTVRAQLARVEEEEANFDFDILEQALQSAIAQNITDLAEQAAQQQLPASHKLGDNDVLVDVRHPDEQQQAPLNLPGANIINIPFFKINDAFAALPQDKQYLLYCPKGVMSQLHAMHLRDQGFDNVGVYRPLGG
ncbi:MAG: tRNA uracil 4-sulfurtransferase ThiI [Gammaproteobacteria bacterium]|jgi:thiamine biosynthesis protein ThiI|nr:tRNA uracil 4-sulfurtransferase ThiI [Gammaproteobacteria bacterium]